MLSMLQLFSYRILLLGLALFSLHSIPLESRSEAAEVHAVHALTARFSLGDDPSWSSPAYDDRHWLSGTEAWRTGAGIGWYRIRFAISPCQTWNDPAIFLGRIDGAEEIFLNGVRIGGEGIVGNGFAGAQKAERLCRIPSGLLGPGQDHLLAVRVMSMHPDRERFPDRIRVGDYHTLFAEKARSESRQIQIEIIILIVLVMNLLICILNLMSGMLPRNMRSFGGFIFLCLIVYAIDSLLFYETGWKTGFLQRTAFSCIVLVPAAVLFMYQERPGVPAKAAAAVMVLGSLSALLLPVRQTFPLLPYAWLILVGVCGVWTLGTAWQGYRRRVPESGIVLTSTICIFVAGILLAVEAFFPLHPFRYYEEVLWILGGPVFMYLRIYALIKLFDRFRRNQIELSRKVLVTQEQERERLSRELHDGIGQSLLAVKLNLDMIEACGDGAGNIKLQLVGLKADLARIIDEVREIAAALRPSVFEKLDLAETLREDGKRLEMSSGIRIEIRTVGKIEGLPPQIRHNIYRIFQEAMTNILKHASATVIKVSLAVKGGSLILKITDNGNGFDNLEAAAAERGLGLSMMRERAMLLSGTLSIQTAPGRGTAVLAEVPVP